MAKTIKPLSDVECRRHKYSAGSAGRNKLRDGGGLMLVALATGRKVWRLEYRSAKGTKNMATYRHDYGTDGGTLTKARQWREQMRALLAEGIDPNQYADQQARQQAAAQLSTFKAIAEEWIEWKSAAWSEVQTKKVRGIVERVLMPWLGKRPVPAITTLEILHCLQRFEKQGKRETAHKAREYAGAIFRRAILHGLVTTNPADALKGALLAKDGGNYAHLKGSEEIGGLLRAIDGFDGMPQVKAALQILPYVFVRPSELREARWSEFNLGEAIWTVPEDRKGRKARPEHVVPLSEQVIATLEELQPVTCHADHSLLFPGARDPRRPISDNTLNAALRRLGYSKDQQTAHGFRHIASTRLHEMGWKSHVIETQLAHKDRDTIRGTYNKAEYLEERREMMQAWADHLDSLKAGNTKVTPIKRVRG